jgi:sugar transferase (PEP-CTERM system associated)
MLKAMDSRAASIPRPDKAAFDDSLNHSPVLATRQQMRLGLLGRLLRQQSLRSFTLLATIEIALLVLAAWLAVELRFHGDAATRSAVIAELPLTSTIFAGVVWLTMIALGLYQRHSNELRNVALGTLTRLVLAMMAGSLALMVLYYIVPEFEVGRGVFALSIAIAFPLLVGSRLVFSRLSQGKGLKRRILLLGSGQKAQGFLEEATSTDRFNRIQVVKHVSPEAIPGSGGAETDQVQQPDRSVASLLDLAFEHGIDDIVVATDDLRKRLSMDELMSCRLAGINVLRLDTLYEREMGRVMLEGLLPSWFVFTGHFDRSVMRRISKRIFDLAAASMIILLSWPIMVVVALAIWIESGGRGKVLYCQERVGEGDSVFTLFKFRSMRSDAEKDGVARWASADDDRVTRVGRVIRKLRLDELPQVYNVLRGEMSMVGPRPERPEIVEQLKQLIPYYALRHSVSPGVTGWAQLRYPYGASVEDAAEKLRYDLYYIKEQGLLFDMQILLQTVEVVLFRRGSR